MPAREIILTDTLDSVIETGVASGRFPDASAVVSEALRLLEERDHEHQAKLEWLRSAAAEGFDDIERGDYTEFNSREELASFVNGMHEEAATEFAAKRG